MALVLSIMRTQEFLMSLTIKTFQRSAITGVHTKVHYITYVGLFEFDVKNGNGTLTLCNGETYSGRF